MRLGIVVQSFGGGGAERQAAIWARLLAAEGHEIAALTNKATLNAVALPEMRETMVPKAGSIDLLAISRRLRSFQKEVDAIIAFEPYLGFCCALARLSVPWMLVTGKVPRHLLAESRLPLAVHRWAFAQASLAVAPSRGMIEAHRELGIRDSKPWTWIPNMAEPEAYVHAQGPKEGVLFVGRLAAVKNPLLAIESAAAVPAPLTLLGGTGDLWPDVESAVAALNGGPPIRIQRFTGEPWEIYARHRVLVVTSQFESFGNVIIESLAAGTPVVSVDCDYGPREILAEARYSRLADPSAPALAEALTETLDRPYGPDEEDECRSIAERYRQEAIAPLIHESVEALGADGL